MLRLLTPGEEVIFHYAPLGKSNARSSGNVLLRLNLLCIDFLYAREIIPPPLALFGPSLASRSGKNEPPHVRRKHRPTIAGLSSGEDDELTPEEHEVIERVKVRMICSPLGLLNRTDLPPCSVICRPEG